MLACNEYISEFGLNNIEIVRLRAHSLAMQFEHKKELSDRQYIIESGQQELKDFYLSGECALNCGEFELAEVYFEALFKLGKVKNETWFESATLFYLAFTQFKLSKFEIALQNILKAIELDSDCALPVPEMPKLLSATDLKHMINQFTK